MDGNVKTTLRAPIKETISHVIARLEEKEAVLSSLHTAWASEEMNDTKRLRVINDVRRTIIDTVCELENLQGFGI